MDLIYIMRFVVFCGYAFMFLLCCCCGGAFKNSNIPPITALTVLVIRLIAARNFYAHLRPEHFLHITHILHR